MKYDSISNGHEEESNGYMKKSALEIMFQKQLVWSTAMRYVLHKHMGKAGNNQFNPFQIMCGVLPRMNEEEQFPMLKIFNPLMPRQLGMAAILFVGAL